MKFFVFDMNAKYDQGFLPDHLAYLQTYDGTPQGDGFPCIVDAVNRAKEIASRGTFAMITDEDYKELDIVARHEFPEGS